MPKDDDARPMAPTSEPKTSASAGAEPAHLVRLLVESVQDYAIFALDPAGTVVSWNIGAERVKGYRADEIIGRSFTGFYTSEDLAAGRPHRLLETAAQEGRVIDEGWRVRKDGSRFWANVTLTALREHGALVGFAKVTRDLTDKRLAEEGLRKSEERFRLLVQSVVDYAIFILDPEGHIVSWNDGAARIKGYSEDEIMGRHFSIFYPPEEREKPGSELAAAIAQGRVEDEGWRLRKDGTLFWANVVITALRKPGGELVGFAKVTRDLTERHEARERALADARRIAAVEASNQAKADFLAVMSHELRTPLNAIGGYVDLLRMGLRGPVTAEQMLDLERVNHAQRHLLTLINDILNYSRIEAGHLVHDTRPIRLDAMLATVADIVEPQARVGGIELIRDRIPAVTVVTDSTKFEQIVLNLLTNALKFTPRGGQVRISATAGRRTVTVRVADTGVGVPEEQAEQIFGPFVQVGRSLTTGHQGMGLGLAISRELARGMGGDLRFEQPRDEGGVTNGAVFVLEIPRKPPGKPPA